MVFLKLKIFNWLKELTDIQSSVEQQILYITISALNTDRSKN